MQAGLNVFASAVSLAITDSDDLLVADLANNEIYTFPGTSSGLNGNTPPARTLGSVDLSAPIGINLCGNGHLYVANNGNGDVLAFDPAVTGNFNGVYGATRTIGSAAFGGVFDVNVGDDDTLYVVDHVNAQIHKFANASTRNGPNLTPDSTLTVDGFAGPFLTAIAIDRDGNAYIVDAANDAVYIYSDIANKQGFLPPDIGTIGSPTATQTQLNTPIRVYLVE